MPVDAEDLAGERGGEVDAGEARAGGRGERQSKGLAGARLVGACASGERGGATSVALYKILNQLQ